MKRLVNLLMMIVAVLLIDLFWVAEDYPIRWFGLIGFGLVGWYWNQEK
jgi:uncharacterized membrane protein